MPKPPKPDVVLVIDPAADSSDEFKAQCERFNKAVAEKARGTANDPVERQRFLDQVAVQLFVKGWPHADIYGRAEVLFDIREHYLAGKAYTKQRGK